MKKCDCSCGCQLTSDETYFEELESVCQGCNKGYREELGIIREVCQKCGEPAFALCNDDCGFLCRNHDATHRHETGHITCSVITVYQEVMRNEL